MASQPISLNRPTAIRTATNKYGPSSPIAPFLASAPPSVQRALANYDVNRVNLGQSPLTNAQTVRAGTALNSLQIRPLLGPLSGVHADAATAAPDRPWWQDAASDVSQILTAVPKMPALLLEEGNQIPNAGQQIQDVLSSETSSPLEKIGGLAQVPGLRLVPGAFTLSQFAPGGQGVGGLTEHPVMTALDVLPYAQKAASLAPSVGLAEDVAQRAAAATNTLPARTTPLSTVFKYGVRGSETTAPEFSRGLGSFGQDVPTMVQSPVYRALSKIPQTLSGGPVGEYMRSAFGDPARAMARKVNRISSDVEQISHNPQYAASSMAGPDVEAAGRAAAAAGDINVEFADINPERQLAVAEAARNGTRLEGLTPRESELFNRYTAEQAAYTEGILPATRKIETVEMSTGSEIYDQATAGRIKGARVAADRQLAVANLLDTLDPASPGRMGADQLLADFTRSMGDKTISGAVKSPLARGYLTALRDAGVDIDAALAVYRKSKNAETLTSLPDLIDLTRTTAQPTQTLESIATALAPLRRSSLPVNRFLTAMSRGDVATALKDVSAIAGLRAVGETLSAAGIDLSELKNLAQQRRAITNSVNAITQAGFTARGLRDAMATRNRIERGAVPPRFQQVVQNAAIPQMVEAVNEARATGRLTGTEADTVLTQVTNRMFRDATQTFPELRQIQSEVRQTWQDLAAEGYDPVFVHNVTPEAARSAQYPRVADHVRSPSQFKARLWDTGGRAEPLSVALHHQGVEYLISKGDRAFADWLVESKMAVPEAEIKGRFMADAQAAHARNPDINMQAHADQQIGKHFVAWSPEEFMTGKVARGGPKYYLPKELAKNIERMRATPSDIAQAVGAPMNVFRTAVLPLSPRWHLNNILGGSITTTAQAANPLTFWTPKRVIAAWKMASRGGPDAAARALAETPEELAIADLAAPGGGARQASELFRNRELKTSTEKLEFLHNNAAGRKLAELNQQGWLSRPQNAGKSLIQWSYDFNQRFDDFYRSMAYLEGSDRALTKGMSRAEQIRAGVQASRKALQNWDELTPIERSTMRMVFPFYSWTRFMLKYVLQYPGDHPWRTSILAALSRTEGHDYGTGLPRDLQTLLFLGEPDKDGKISAINTAGFNPFRDTANYATLAGFLTGGGGDVSAITSQVNPLLSTALEWAGVDPAQGTADLYPELTYDPDTGRLVATPKSNPLFSAAGNFLPQLNAVTAFAGMNAQYRQIAAQDPQAAGRYLMSTLGVPVLKRDVDLPREIIGSEVTRYNQQRQSLSSGLSSGDLSSFARQYPGMRALVDRIQVLSQNPDFIRQYGAVAGRRGTYQPSILETLAS